ncbi:MAG: hypothetical protein V4562_01390 [Pseudomonadota bacterium]
MFLGTLAACGGGGGGTTATTQTTIASTPDVPPAPAPAPAPAPSPAPAPAPVPFPAGSPEAASIERLNDERGRCGFGTLRMDGKLNQAAFNHVNFNAYQASLGNWTWHIEILGQPYFTGFTLFDRALHVGYTYRELWENMTTAVWTNVTGQPNLGDMAVFADDVTRGLLTTVYHLRGMMVQTNDVGVAALHQQYGTTVVRAYVMELGAKIGETGPAAQTGVLHYPCQGTTAAKAVFKPSDEVPNPRPGHGGTLGTPIYLRAPAGETISISSQQITVLSSGAPVAAQVMTSANDPAGELGRSDAFVVPDAALTPGVTYRVRVSGMAGSIAFSKDYTFTPS